MRIEVGGRVMERAVGEVKLEELIDSLQKGLLDEGWVISDLVLNGQELPHEEFERRKRELLPESTHIKLRLERFVDVMVQQLRGADEFHREVEQHCLRVARDAHSSSKVVGKAMYDLRDWSSFWRTWVTTYPNGIRELQIDKSSLMVWLHRGRCLASEATAAWRDGLLPTARQLLMETAVIVGVTRKALEPMADMVSKVG